MPQDFFYHLSTISQLDFVATQDNQHLAKGTGLVCIKHSNDVWVLDFCETIFIDDHCCQDKKRFCLLDNILSFERWRYDDFEVIAHFEFQQGQWLAQSCHWCRLDCYHSQIIWQSHAIVLIVTVYGQKNQQLIWCYY